MCRYDELVRLSSVGFFHEVILGWMRLVRIVIILLSITSCMLFLVYVRMIYIGASAVKKYFLLGVNSEGECELFAGS